MSEAFTDEEFQFMVRSFAEGDVDAIAERLDARAWARARRRANAVLALRDDRHRGR